MSQLLLTPGYLRTNSGISKFFKLVIALHLGLWGVIGLNLMGLQIPFIRQFVSLIYLILLPGILILKILRLNNLNNIETILYSVGLSISILMFTGFFLNLFSPILGISKPISLFPLMFTMNIIILILCILCYIQSYDSSNLRFFDIKPDFSLSSLSLYLIPFLSIIGTYLVNFHQNSILLYLLLIILSLIPISAIFFNIPSENSYPTTIFIIALSLLYHWSLIGMYLSGGDSHYEYHYSNLVYLNSYWNSTISNSINSMLSIVILAPMISIISDMNLIWVFKIVFPLLYALVPLGLYDVFQKQIDKKSAFLSTFFFMAVFPFFSEMLQLARQQIAELFFILLIILMLDKNMNHPKRALLSILFALSLGVSHYGLSYFYLCLLIVSMIILSLGYHNKGKINITYTFLLTYLVFILAWYIYLSSSSAIITIVHVMEHITQNLMSSFLNPETSQGLAMITNDYSQLHEITKYFYLISQLFIFIGVISILFIPSKLRFKREYHVFSVVCLIICLAGIAIPNFASAMNTTRLFHINLFFLAPFAVTGIQTTLDFFSKISTAYNVSAKKVFSIYLMFFLLLTSGFFYELAGDSPVSIALNNTFDATRYNDKEVHNAKWISNNINDSKIYADPYGKYLLDEFPPNNKIDLFSEDTTDGFLYLREFNLKNETIFCFKKEKTLSKIDYISLKSDFYIYANKIYSNGGSDLLELIPKTILFLVT